MWRPTLQYEEGGPSGQYGNTSEGRGQGRGHWHESAVTLVDNSWGQLRRACSSAAIRAGYLPFHLVWNNKCYAFSLQGKPCRPHWRTGMWVNSCWYPLWWPRYQLCHWWVCPALQAAVEKRLDVPRHLPCLSQNIPVQAPEKDDCIFQRLQVINKQHNSWPAG